MSSQVSSTLKHGQDCRLFVDSMGSKIVAPVSFSLQAGECLAVKGRSGVGKTRLLRLIADLDEGAGDVFLDGESRSTMPAPVWRRQVIYQSAEPSWWMPTVRQHFSFEQGDYLATMAERFALPVDRLDADISLLSTGERQRAALIRSLAFNPKVLLLDEPTSALDRLSVQLVESYLVERMEKGLAIVLVTHAEDQMMRLSTKSIELSRRAEA